MKGLSVDQIRKLDKQAKGLGLEESLLIENASSNLFELIKSLNLGQKVFVVAGRGNNGADVLSCARKLASRGFKVKIALLEDKPLGKEALRQKLILEKIDLPLFSITADSFDKLKQEAGLCDFVLEGILGVGVKGEVSPFLKEVITIVNQNSKRIVSCDIPSGLSPDQGFVLGTAIKADYTVTFIAPKKGFFLNQGPEYCGQVFVVDIGISKEILEAVK
ncbi:MAG: NAD(P)H-hydrate epimerase [Candidatus Omnitrophica bacterium]|nr:NAD(P)H-hydrate epimerase [Candidatus Omnitrophota bacterium]